LDGNDVAVPASHAVLRGYAYNDQVAYPWFAPAGLTRGVLSGVSNLGLVNAENEFVPLALNQGQRDTLYQDNVNPLVNFPGQGLFTWGQKTLYPFSSALDRVNVARLLVYLRKQFDIIARPFIFEPNDKITRDRVIKVFNGFMADMVTKRAVYDFLVVCDETNNTPTRIDRNELYIDIAIEPVKAIEFIYIPVRVVNTGAIANNTK
jgi:phage tail sheath protein FI